MSDDDEYEYYEDDNELLTKRNLAIAVVALLVVIILFVPMTITTYQGGVPSAVLTSNGWEKEDGESEDSTKYLRFVKLHTNVYQNKGSLKQGKLFVISANTLTTPDTDSFEERIVETVEEKAEEAGVRLKSGPTTSTLTLKDGTVATRYNWEGEVSSKAFFGVSVGTDITITAAIWNADESTIICAGYSVSALSSQVTNLIKSVEESEA